MTSRAAVARLEDAEPQLKGRDRRPRQQARAELPADDPADQQQESCREVDTAVARIPGRRRGRDRHDRQQARGAGPALVEGEPHHQQRNHSAPTSPPTPNSPERMPAATPIAAARSHHGDRWEPPASVGQALRVRPPAGVRRPERARVGIGGSAVDRDRVDDVGEDHRGGHGDQRDPDP